VEEFGIARNTIFYHLREEGKDGRFRYTKDERRRLLTASKEELAAFATRTGKSLLAVQRLVAREKQKTENHDSGQRTTFLMLQGYFNFDDEAELHLFGFTLTDVVMARRVLRPFGLTVENRSLLHPASGRFFLLTMEDQEELLHDAEAFLRRHAARIKEGWRTT